ncbi:PqaA type PhoPQ-activated pathogenicity-related protein, partial [Ochromonadaceae sp. CCMP2298]
MNALVRASLFFVALSSVAVCATATALDDYVWAPDENYGWVEMGKEYEWTSSVAGRNYTAYTLNMTSQRWLTDADFSPDSQGKSIWWHYLVVIVPENVQWSRNATLWITGGSMSSAAPHAKDEDITVTAALACNTGTVAAALFQIPNEHVTFAADPIQQSRTEDAIIAFTWDHFIKDPTKPEWLLRFPMVKATLRAMDTITAFVKAKFPEKDLSLDYYTVSGASKRGWTTWDVGAVDQTGRVAAIVPIVLDAINFVEVEHHQYRSY